MKRIRVNTKVNFGGRYYFSSFIYAKGLETVKRTKAYKYYEKQLNEGKIVGFELEYF